MSVIEEIRWILTNMSILNLNLETLNSLHVYQMLTLHSVSFENKQFASCNISSGDY